MARYVLVGDVHATERPPSSCTDSYLDDLLDLLRQVVVLTESASGLVIAGDLFHHKAPSRTSHRLVMQLLEVLARAKCLAYVVPGNHDVQHDRLDSIDDTQPLGVLLHSDVVSLLDGWADDVLYGVPWQQHWTDAAVYEELGRYRRDRDKNELLYTLVVTHAPLYPPGRELSFEHYPAAKFAAAMGNVGSVFYGHVHEPHGVYEVDGVTFCNNGALSRGSLHEYNLTREVCATVWDSKTGLFERVPLKAKPASEVFRLQEKQQVTDMQGRLDEFLEQISSAQLDVVSVERVMEHVRGMGLGQPVEALIEELVEEASHAG